MNTTQRNALLSASAMFAVMALFIGFTYLFYHHHNGSNTKLDPMQQVCDKKILLKELPFLKIFQCNDAIQIRQYYNTNDYWSVLLNRHEQQAVDAILPIKAIP